VTIEKEVVLPALDAMKVLIEDRIFIFRNPCAQRQQQSSAGHGTEMLNPETS
jgi:hypothetical protein